MAFSSIVYESVDGEVQGFKVGDNLSFNSNLEVENIRVGEAGEWVVVNYVESDTNSDGSFMIPKERVVRIGEGDLI